MGLSRGKAGEGLEMAPPSGGIYVTIRLLVPSDDLVYRPVFLFLF